MINQNLIMHKSMPAHKYLFKYAVIILSLAFICNCGETTDLPSNLLGTWQTEAEQYENRLIEIDTKLLTFGTGYEEPNIYFIRGINHKKVGNEDEYTFKCVNDEDVDFQFVFYFENSSMGLTMRLKNPRQVIWTKVS